MSTRSCKIFCCKEDHIRHYCRVCNQNDSDHFSRHCPNGTVLYHGIDLEIIKSLEEERFNDNSIERRFEVGLDLDVTLNESQKVIRNIVVLLRFILLFLCNVFIHSPLGEFLVNLSSTPY